jgi:hypothetical protein
MKKNFKHIQTMAKVYANKGLCKSECDSDNCPAGGEFSTNCCTDCSVLAGACYLISGQYQKCKSYLSSEKYLKKTLKVDALTPEVLVEYLI